MSSPESDASVVYAIGSPEHRYVKVGVTFNLPLRLAALHTSSPFPLRVLWRHAGGRELERFLHLHLREFRVRGEWFDFGAHDAVNRLAESVAQYRAGAAPAAPRATVLRFITGRFLEAKAEGDGLRKELAIAIREATKTGIPQKDICEATGYTRQQIHRIVQNDKPDANAAESPQGFAT